MKKYLEKTGAVRELPLSFQVIVGIGPLAITHPHVLAVPLLPNGHHMIALRSS